MLKGASKDLVVYETWNGTVVVAGDGWLEVYKDCLVAVRWYHTRRRLQLEHTLMVINIKLQQTHTALGHLAQLSLLSLLTLTHTTRLDCTDTDSVDALRAFHRISQSEHRRVCITNKKRRLR